MRTDNCYLQPTQELSTTCCVKLQWDTHNFPCCNPMICCWLFFLHFFIRTQTIVNYITNNPKDWTGMLWFISLHYTRAWNTAVSISTFLSFLGIVIWDFSDFQCTETDTQPAVTEFCLTFSSFKSFNYLNYFRNSVWQKRHHFPTRDLYSLSLYCCKLQILQQLY